MTNRLSFLIIKSAVPQEPPVPGRHYVDSLHKDEDEADDEHDNGEPRDDRHDEDDGGQEAGWEVEIGGNQGGNYRETGKTPSKS